MTNIAIRSMRSPGALEVRAASDGTRKLFGHFSRFNTWYEVRSAREGHFLEVVAPGAFARAFQEQRSQIRVMFDHGQDPTVGQKPLGTIVDLREDSDGAYYEVDLFDSSYVNDLVPAINSDQMGASFRFSVPEGGDDWDYSPKRSAHNPAGVPERTIRDTDLYEFGPVVWGASPTATSNIRSGTDEWIEHLLNDPLFVARLTERAGAKVVERMIETSADGEVNEDDGESRQSDAPADGQAEESTKQQRLDRIKANLAAFRHQIPAKEQ